MQLFRNWRERSVTAKVNRIEGQVVKISQKLTELDPDEDMFQLGEVLALERRRKELWLRRSELIKKLPPVYQEEQ